VGFDTENFFTAMRVVLRQDPDVILVGEMRDPETVYAALSAAETGHLVLSTLHTINATETINRIVDFFPPHQQRQIRVTLAGCLKGTICQRLVPRADGKGRVPAVEVMLTTGRIQQLILDPKLTGDIEELIAEGEFYGMQTFDQSLVRLIADGVVDLKDAMDNATNQHDLRVLLESMGILKTGRAASAPSFEWELGQRPPRIGAPPPSGPPPPPRPPLGLPPTTPPPR
jgi:twitching motility protein PilT